MRVTIPEVHKITGQLKEALKGVPEEKRAEVEIKFWSHLSYELRELLLASTRAQGEAEVFLDMRQAGEQYLWEFSVNDLDKPRDPHSSNWHGQNTSQWVYAGALMVHDDRVSCHH